MSRKINAVAISIVLFGLAVWHFNSGVVFTNYTINSINRGMTTNEVIKIIGKPSEVDLRNHTWYYYRFTYTIGGVHFDDNWRVIDARNE